jgi:hypothetical protein
VQSPTSPTPSPTLVLDPAAMANILTIIRIKVLVLTLLFSIVVLGLAADITSRTQDFDGSYFQFAALAIATAVLTLVSLPVFLIVDFVRTGAFTSMVVVELVWFSVLWVLWLSVGADTANVNSIFFPDGCGFIIRGVINTACHEFAAITAFGFLAWIALFAYVILLLVFAIIGQSKGQRVWTSSVKESNFLAPAAGAKYGGYPQATAPQMADQHQHPPTAPPPVQHGYQQSSVTSVQHGYTQSPPQQGHMGAPLPPANAYSQV